MYDASDPRSTLVSASPAQAAKLPETFAAGDFGLFYEQPPQDDEPTGQTWYIRGQNILVAYTMGVKGAVLEREDQPDEYALLLYDAAGGARVTAAGETRTLEGGTVTFVPPGASRIELLGAQQVLRLFTTRSADLLERCANRDAYREARPNIAAHEPWPTPPDGFKIRSYDLDVAPEPGRFGRIWRCTTLMVNALDPQMGPRDVTKLSPHHHDDFEQCSIALVGSFTHHLRWPWTPNLTAWRDDEHHHVQSPSVLIIPPPAVHTTRGMDEGLNQLIDVFAPPRRDFSDKGWVLNASDYPAPPDDGH